MHSVPEGQAENARDTVLQALFLLIVRARQTDDRDRLNELEELRGTIWRHSRRANPGVPRNEGRGNGSGAPLVSEGPGKDATKLM